jgi:hypothetical protein
MAEKSNTKAMMALLSRPQMILLSSLALILLLAMVGGAFIYQRHFSVQQLVTRQFEGIGQ